MKKIKELFIDIDRVFRPCPTIVNDWKDMMGKPDVIDWEPCTVYETHFYTDDGYLVTFAWVAGRGHDDCATIAITTSKTGWVLGHKDYVIERPIPDKLIDCIEGCTVKRLWLIDELPGFSSGGVHDSGWFSKGLFAIKEDHPAVCLG